MLSFDPCGLKVRHYNGGCHRVACEGSQFGPPPKVIGCCVSLPGKARSLQSKSVPLLKSAKNLAACQPTASEAATRCPCPILLLSFWHGCNARMTGRLRNSS